MKARLFQEVLLSKADGTISGYLYKIRQFFSWLKEMNIAIKLPIRDEIIAVFIVDQSSSEKSVSATITLASAVKWLHSLVNSKPNPVDSPIVQQTINAEKRKLHKPPVQKKPLSLDMRCPCRGKRHILVCVYPLSRLLID